MTNFLIQRRFNHGYGRRVQFRAARKWWPGQSSETGPATVLVPVMAALRGIAVAVALIAGAIVFCAQDSVAGSPKSPPDRSTLQSALRAGCNLEPSQPATLRQAFPDGRIIVARIDRLRGQSGRSVHRVLMPDGGEWSIMRLFPAGRLRRVTVDWYAPLGGDQVRPVISVNANADCQVLEGRRLIYGSTAAGAAADKLEILAPDLVSVVATEDLNPPVPGRRPISDAQSTQGRGGAQAVVSPVQVAVVDSGINYTLPLFQGRLARNPDGGLIGYDFWDMDDRPFDVDVARSPFFPLRHGTAVTSIILREAPAAVIVPYRYPRPDMSRFGDLIAHADRAGVVIVNLAMGSNRAADWRAFETAAKARPHMLFIVSAGNDGRDIDQTPVYPAALDMDNLLTVTSSDDWGRLAPGSNWGGHHVDLMVPGENIPVIDHRGAQAKTSGSSFAVPRISALAARLMVKHPEWRAPELKAAILKRARPVGNGQRVRGGGISDPTDDFER